jgi:hypothetical protein
LDFLGVMASFTKNFAPAIKHKFDVLKCGEPFCINHNLIEQTPPAPNFISMF